jgi:hypothetical protein
MHSDCVSLPYIHSIPAPHSNMKTIYITEAGTDLFDAFPDIKQMNAAVRNGVSWYDMEFSGYYKKVANPPIQIVVTTKAALAKRHKTQVDAAVAQFIAMIVGRPESERTMDALVESAATFGLTLDPSLQSDFVNTVCEVLVAQNHVVPTTVAIMPSTPVKPTRHTSYIQALIKNSPPPKTSPELKPLFPNVIRKLDFDADTTSWYYQDASGMPVGPLTETAMRALWRRHNVTKRTPVRCGVSGCFTPIGHMFGRQTPFTQTRIV